MRKIANVTRKRVFRSRDNAWVAQGSTDLQVSPQAAGGGPSPTMLTQKSR